MEPSIEKLIRSVSIKFRRQMDAYVGQYQLNGQQARLLHALYYMDNKGMIQKELQPILGTRGASITSMIQGLEKRGLLYRKTGSRDAREKRLFLTVEGKRIVEDINLFLPKPDEEITEILSEAEQKQLFKLLKKLNDAIY
ncbi:MarR family transcriptional regulator [Listeria floridensis FSL S10-1187]|uniref:MarR family transcriptional regulator n=1 Tax=Listeria floridensis FSL S10-1187 TaxID=1265817 RepID=A0ABP3B3D8_9LIST|nr:MarR family transcriptional regulator [Listeria floridensis]EUJ33612.1 MarR family transcriptional regulator [Listeria floridensis FSL S10-1187]